jgi:uncharacterized protein
LVVGVGSAVLGAAFWVTTQPWWQPEWRVQMSQFAQPTAEMVQKELASYRGGWLEQFLHRWQVSIASETMGFLAFVAWRAGGMMLVGMGLFKLRVFSAALPRKTYWTMAAIGFLVGVPIIAWGIRQSVASGWEPVYRQFLGGQYNYWASILVSLGWVGVVMLVCRNPRLGPLTRPLGAVGQMAFTNYLLHTIICTTLFYGFGFRLFGRLDRFEQLGVVLAVWTFQLVASPLWLRFFRLGPAEWLWRTLTYFELQPFLRRVPS